MSHDLIQHPATAWVRVARVISMVRGISWGLIDQATISATSFVTMVLLARQLGPGPFGHFVIAYSVLIFANNVQEALFIQPHNVIGATRAQGDYPHYTTSVVIGQFVFSCGVAIVFLLASIAARTFDDSIGTLLLVLAPLSITWQMQELFRRVLYTSSGYQRAARITLTACAIQFTGLFVLWYTDRLSASSAMGVMCLATLAGAITGAWLNRGELLFRINRNQTLETLQENWHFGRWLLAACLMNWVSGHLYPFLTAGLVGSAAAGGLRATQNLVAPTHVLIKGAETMFPSRAALAYVSGGARSLRGYLGRTLFPIGGGVLVYCAVILTFAEPFTRLLLGPDYVQYAWLARAFAISYIGVYISLGALIALSAMKQSSSAFLAYAISAATVLTLGVVMVKQFGLPGAAAGIIGHTTLLSVVLWIQVFRHWSRELGRANDGNGVLLLQPEHDTPRPRTVRKEI